jgi:hypothetical protein
MPAVDLYSSRLTSAMEQRKCAPRVLAKACGCSEELIKRACKAGNDTPLGTHFHHRAALFLEQDPTRLLCGNSVPINPALEGPVTFFTLADYEREDAEGKQLFHKQLFRAVAALPDPPRRSLKKT